jgi:hypothetical protein
MDMNKKVKFGLSIWVLIVIGLVVINSSVAPSFINKNSFELSSGLVGAGIGSFFGPVGSFIGGATGLVIGSQEEVEAFLHVVIAVAVGATIGGALSLGGGCHHYQPPKSGNCEACNANDIFDECTAVRCWAIGRNCEYIEQEGEKNICLERDCSDVTKPKITGCEAIDLDDGHDIDVTHTDTSCVIEESIAEFSSVAFKIDTDQFTKCTIAGEAGVAYGAEGSSLLSSEDLFTKDHYFAMTIADVDEEFLNFCQAGEICKFYIRCGNVCDYATTYDYVLSFDVVEAPDIEPPIIGDTVVESGSFFSVGTTSIDFWMYVHDLSGLESCKWTTDEDLEYDDMEGSFTCSEEYDVLAGGYLCQTELTGLSEDEDNIFYFSCKDTAEAQNVVKPYEEFILKGSTALEIISVEAPDDVYYDEEAEVSVTTNRESTCTYTFNGESDEFESTTNVTSTHEFEFTSSGSVHIAITCLDDYGNYDTEDVSFTVDLSPPELLRTYTSQNRVYILLNRGAECRYSNDEMLEFSNVDIIPMAASADEKEHMASLNANVYYIVCRDNLDQEVSFTVYP